MGFQGWLVMIGFLLSEAANAEPKMDGGFRDAEAGGAEAEAGRLIACGEDLWVAADRGPVQLLFLASFFPFFFPSLISSSFFFF